MPARDDMPLQVALAAATLGGRVARVHDALESLRTLTVERFERAPSTDEAIARWLDEARFDVDADGYFQSLTDLERLRAGTLPPDRASVFWPPARRDDLEARRRMYALRDVGPVLARIRERIRGLAWVYYQDVSNTAVVYPACDWPTVIPPDFEWSGYHTYVSVTPENSPDRGVRWTAPNVDYGGHGLISGVSIPVYLGDRFVGLWSIDVPHRTLHTDVVTRTAIEQESFIADLDGHLVAHPRIETASAREKGSVFLESLTVMGGDFARADVRSLAAAGHGRHEWVDGAGRRFVVFHHKVPEVDWVVFATAPVDRMLEATAARLHDAFARLGQGDRSFRIEAAGPDALGSLSDAYNAMATALEAHEADQALLQERVLQTQRMEAVGQLAAGVAHDFNNLLTVILGCASALEARLRDEDLRLVDQIERSAERAATLTAQLLAFTRQELIEPRVLDVRRVVADILPMLGRLLGATVTLESRAPEAPCLVSMDRGQLEQVVVNLAVNARDAMPSGGRLLVSVARVEPDRVRLSVEDEGTGITPEVRSRIFEPFFTTKPRGHGTGLGLPTVQGIVQRSGGTIAIASDPGRGTRFDIDLPAVEGPEPAVAPAPEAARGGREPLLVVEDDEDVRETLVTALAGAGYEVSAARTVDAALDHQGPFAMVLTDVVMPGRGGPALVAALRARGHDVPVLYITGYNSDDAVRRDLERPHVYALSKPFGPEQLLVRVRQILDAAA